MENQEPMEEQQHEQNKQKPEKPEKQAKKNIGDPPDSDVERVIEPEEIIPDDEPAREAGQKDGAHNPLRENEEPQSPDDEQQRSDDGADEHPDNRQ